MSVRALTLAVILICATALAQGKTWVVDAAGRTGYNFKTIAGAVNAASNGDTVLVRAVPKAYDVNGVSVTKKGLRILGLGTPMLSGLITILRLEAGQYFAMKNFKLWGTLSVLGSKGTVVLENLAGLGLELDIRSSAMVMCDSCAISGWRASASVRAVSSTLIMVDCTVVGMPYISGHPIPSPAQPAGTFTNSRVSLSGGSFTHGYGFVGSPPGVELNGGVLELNGSVMIIGVGAAISTYLGSIRMDASTTLRGAVKIAGNATVKKEDFPGISADGAGPGGKVQVKVRGTKGDAVVPSLGLLVTPVPTVWGPLYLNSGHLFLGPFGTLDKNGNYSWTIPVPNIAGLRGIVLGTQAATRGINGRAILSTPTAFVVH